MLGAGVVVGAGGAIAVAGLPTAQAIQLSAAAIMSGFERFLDARNRVIEMDMVDTLELEFDDVPEEIRLDAVDEELEFERAYRAKVRARLDAKLPRILQIPDPVLREAELKKVLEAERRIARQREEAMAVRALGNLEARIVEAKSPGGAYWALSEHVQQHTVDCLAMGGRVWPWSVLRRFRPPLHVGCECELKTVQEARRLGLPGADLPMNPDAAFYAMQMPHDGHYVQEAPDEELEEELRVLEARYDERYGKGTSLGGQFKPRRGAKLGRPTALRARRRRRGPRLDVPEFLTPSLPDPAASPAASVTKKRGRDLEVGDEVFTAGKWRKVEAVNEKAPGAVTLEDLGLVLLDPEKDWDVRPAVGDEGAGETVKARDLREGDVFTRWDRRYTVIANEVGTGGRGRSVRATADSGTGEEVVIRFGATDDVPVISRQGLDPAKVEATRKVIRAASDEDLLSTRASWAAKSDPASRAIVELYDEEIRRRGLLSRSNPGTGTDWLTEVNAGAGGRGGLAGDWDMDGGPSNMRIDLRQKIAGLPKKAGATLTLPGGVRIVGGHRPDRLRQGSGAERAFRVHWQGGHQDVDGPDRAAMLALERSAQSTDAASLGGAMAYNDYREAWLTDEQRATLAKHKLVGWAPGEGLPVIGRVAAYRQVNRDGSIEDLPYGLAFDKAHKQPAPVDPTAAGRGGDVGGLPELPEPGPTDRFALRYGPNASIEMFNIETGEEERAWRGEWDLDKVLEDLRETNRKAAQRAAPAASDIVDTAQIEALGRMKEPGEAGEIAPGVRYDPDATKMREENGELVLGPGFFRMRDRKLREKVVLRHLGRRFVEDLSSEELEELERAGLAKRSQIVEAMHVLNTPKATQWHAENTAATVAFARLAKAKGYPLDPDVEKLAGDLQAGGEAEERANRSLVDDVRERLMGKDDDAAMTAWSEAGFTIGGYESKDGKVAIYVRNMARDSTMRVGFENGKVSSVDELEVPEADVTTAGGWATVLSGQARPSIDLALMNGDLADPFLDTTTLIDSDGGDWSIYTSAGGKSLAVRFERGRGVEFKAVAATPDDVERAQGRRLTANPHEAIKPGDSYADVRAALVGVRGGYEERRPYAAGDKPKLPFGIEDVVDFEHSGDKKRNVRVYLRKSDDGDGLVIAQVGYPVAVWPAPIQDRAGWHRQVDEQQAAERAAREAEQRRERERRERVGAENATIDEFVEKLRANPKGGVEAAQATGMTTSDFVRALQGAGWHIEKAGRTRVDGRPGQRYTLSSRQGETLTITGRALYADQAVTAVKYAPNPQGGKRKRLAPGKAPKDKKELYVDALGRADELAARFGGVAFVTAVEDGSPGRNAAAVHRWGGAIVMGNGKYTKLGARLDTYLKKRKKGEPLTDKDHINFYDAMSTLQHEINHGVGKAGNEEGGLAFGSRHYRKSKPHEMAMEEALTEETARILTLEWLESFGMTDVLVAVKRNMEPPAQPKGMDPGRRPILRKGEIEGSYTNYRARLKAVFDDAGVEGYERRELLLRMKFDMTPEERMTFLDERLKARRGAGAVAPTRQTMSSNRNYTGPVWDDPLEHIEVPERPGDGRQIGDRVQVLDDSGQPVWGRVDHVWTGGDLTIALDDGSRISWVDPGRVLKFEPSTLNLDRG